MVGAVNRGESLIVNPIVSEYFLTISLFSITRPLEFVQFKVISTFLFNLTPSDDSESDHFSQIFQKEKIKQLQQKEVSHFHKTNNCGAEYGTFKEIYNNSIINHMCNFSDKKWLKNALYVSFKQLQCIQGVLYIEATQIAKCFTKPIGTTSNKNASYTILNREMSLFRAVGLIHTNILL